MAEVCANSEDPDQMLCSAASDLGLHYLPYSLLGVSRLQWDILHHSYYLTRLGHLHFLTHLCGIDSSAFSLWTSPFQIYGVL